MAIAEIVFIRVVSRVEACKINTTKLADGPAQ